MHFSNKFKLSRSIVSINITAREDHIMWMTSVHVLTDRALCRRPAIDKEVFECTITSCIIFGYRNGAESRFAVCVWWTVISIIITAVYWRRTIAKRSTSNVIIIAYSPISSAWCTMSMHHGPYRDNRVYGHHRVYRTCRTFMRSYACLDLRVYNIWYIYLCIFFFFFNNPFPLFIFAEPLSLSDDLFS